MGCFGKIGFISSLPISWRDDTTLIFMIPNKYKDNGGITYSTDWYQPFMLPIHGKYDDYGSIEEVVNTDSVKFIEEFFGLDIKTIISEVDDNSVGRGGSKTSATKNKEIYEKLHFGLEHTKVYKKLSSIRVNAYENDYIYDWWLIKLGFNKIEDNNDKRYKHTWKHKLLEGYTWISDGRSGSLCADKESWNKNIPKYIFHPKDLDDALMLLSKSNKSQISEEDKLLCSIDLSVINTKLAILEYEKANLDEDVEDLRKRIRLGTGIPNYLGYPKINDYIDNLFIDGKRYNRDSYTCPESLLNSVQESEISDFIRFDESLSKLNAKYQPSNYGSQSVEIKLHLEMIKCYRDIIVNKMGNDDESDYSDELLEVKSDERDEKIIDTLN